MSTCRAPAFADRKRSDAINVPTKVSTAMTTATTPAARAGAKPQAWCPEASGRLSRDATLRAMTAVKFRNRASPARKIDNCQRSRRANVPKLPPCLSAKGRVKPNHQSREHAGVRMAQQADPARQPVAQDDVGDRQQPVQNRPGETS